MKIGDLVGLTHKGLNMGLVVGFDLEDDPIVEWIIYPENWASPTSCSTTTYEYRESLTILSGVEDGV